MNLKAVAHLAGMILLCAGADALASSCSPRILKIDAAYDQIVRETVSAGVRQGVSSFSEGRAVSYTDSTTILKGGDGKILERRDSNAGLFVGMSGTITCLADRLRLDFTHTSLDGTTTRKMALVDEPVSIPVPRTFRTTLIIADSESQQIANDGWVEAW